MKRRLARRGTLFVDTNLLVLLLVGAVDPAQVERFKRTRAYTREDFDRLDAFVGDYERMLTTPNVLTEVSNLLGQLAEPLRQRALLALGVLSQQLDEAYLRSRELVGDRHFLALGLSDTSIMRSVDRDATVLTDDLELYLRLQSAGIEAINFNHLRSGSWD